MKKTWAFVFLCSLAVTATAQIQTQSGEPDLRKFAVDAYTYLYPLVLLDRVQMKVVDVGGRKKSVVMP